MLFLANGGCKLFFLHISERSLFLLWLVFRSAAGVTCSKIKLPLTVGTCCCFCSARFEARLQSQPVHCTPNLICRLKTSFFLLCRNKEASEYFNQIMILETEVQISAPQKVLVCCSRKVSQMFVGVNLTKRPPSRSCINNPNSWAREKGFISNSPHTDELGAQVQQSDVFMRHRPERAG